MLDLVYASGMVVAGDDGPGEWADVGVANGRIVAVGSLAGRDRRTTIDVSGLCVAPGFIDLHSHSDFACLGARLAESKIRQGITTEIVGNCGVSAAPLVGVARAAAKDECGPWGVVPDWRSTADYLATVERRGTAVNVGTLVGHGTLRLGVVGAAARAATAPEVGRMCRSLETSLRDGAWGLSSGLFYAPGCYAGPGELVALAAVAAATDHLYATHIRGETWLLRESLAEALSVAEASGSRLQISHLKAAGAANHGTMPEVLSLLDLAADRGIRVRADVYPYEAGQTSLGALLPPWVQAGGTPATARRLRDRVIRDRVETELGQSATTWDNLGLATGWDRIVINRSVGSADLVGRSLAELARDRQVMPERVVCDLVASGEGTAGILAFMLDPGDVIAALAWPRSVVATDAAAVTGRGQAGTRPHPRCAGTFPRVLGRLTRDGTLSLARAVAKMTGEPADIMGIRDRGRIIPGLAADIVAFDPQLVSDCATYDQPLLPPRGIVWVMVNGVMVVADGRPTGCLPGQALRSRGTGEG